MNKLTMVSICLLTLGIGNNFNSQKIAPCGDRGSSVATLGRNVRTNASLRIISQPLPKYPQNALFRHVEGIVSLRITFLANGNIGKITVIRSLPEGLTREAIIAARQIKFVPEKKNGKRITVSKVMEYRFRGLKKCL